jgi:acyl-CoA thioesterase FadM
VRVDRVGRSAVHLAFRVRSDVGDVTKALGSTVVVTVSLDPENEHHMRPMAIPEDLAARIRSFADGDSAKEQS